MCQEKKGKRRIISIENYVDASGLESYVKKNKERLMIETNNNIGNPSTHRKLTNGKKNNPHRNLYVVI